MDFDILTVNPERDEKCSVLSKFGNEMIGWVMNRSISSAYMLSLYELLDEVYPLISGCFRMAVSRGSIVRANRRGERRYPCLVPLPILKNSELHPGRQILV